MHAVFLTFLRRLNDMELLPFGNKPTYIQNTPKIVLALTLTLVFLAAVPLCYPLLSPAFLWNVFSSSSLSTSSFQSIDNQPMNRWTHKKCDLFTGEWVPNPDAPYCTNTTCWAIHYHQNCMKYGRPDRDFMKWRWKPDGCELPIFDPVQFLELVRGKSLVFVGDSVGRNQMQSLICLLSRVEYPIDVSYTSDDKSRRWLYTSYNFTVANYWSPFLIRAKEAETSRPSPSGIFYLYLDKYDEDWTTQIDDFYYVIISAEHWFFRPTIFYENGQIVGCHHCQKQNITDLTMYYSYRRAFQTSFRAINGLKNFKGTTFLRTFSPSHFENGLWNEGGDCVRTRPFRSNESRLEGTNLEVYMIQVEEFRKAKEEGKKRGLNFQLLDTTEAMLLRPDGHPSRYGHWPNDNVTMPNDCVHWCLPGPVDTWNDFLLEMLMMEDGGSSSERK